MADGDAPVGPSVPSADGTLLAARSLTAVQRAQEMTAGEAG